MNEEVIPEQVKEQEESKAKLQDPYELIKSKGGPTKEQILAMKGQTPNGKLKVFTSDGGGRIFIVRAVSGLENAALSRQLSKNLEPDQRAQELEYLISAKCTVWTNITSSGKLQSEELKAAPAGLAATLFNFIAWMSEYVNPEAFEMLSVDL